MKSVNDLTAGEISGRILTFSPFIPNGRGWSQSLFSVVSDDDRKMVGIRFVILNLMLETFSDVLSRRSFRRKYVLFYKYFPKICLKQKSQEFASFDKRKYLPKACITFSDAGWFWWTTGVPCQWGLRPGGCHFLGDHDVRGLPQRLRQGQQVPGLDRGHHAVQLVRITTRNAGTKHVNNISASRLKMSWCIYVFEFSFWTGGLSNCLVWFLSFRISHWWAVNDI